MKAAELIFALFLLALCNSFAIYGLWRAGDPNMILEKPKEFLKKWMGDFASKPFLGCYKCMASVWAGLPMFLFLLTEYPTMSILQAVMTAIFYTCLVSGMLIMIAAIVDYLDYSE